MAPTEHGSGSLNEIRVMRDADVPRAHLATYRYSRGTVVLVTGLILGAGAALVGIGRVQNNPFANYIAALAFMFLWIYQSLVLARFRPTNWLVRVGERGVYVRFRSYLNHHFPESEPTVVYIPFRDMRLSRLVRELQDVQDTDGRGTLRRRRTIVEIDLKDDAPAVQQALAAERQAAAPKVKHWYGTSASKYRHYPVRMAAPGTIAIEWGVRPPARDFLGILALHAPIDASEIVRDFTSLGTLDQDDQESRLIELTENGQVGDAIRLARSLYGYDLTQAKLFVEGLAGRAKA